MSRVWTENQHDAIFARGGSVLVSAAAGSGKTAVLVQRVIELLTDRENPVDADRLLIVTFTRAAAAEMKERITAAIDDLLSQNPGDSTLIRQKQLLYKAHISTIDSFCIDVSREYFYELDINRDFRIADSNELRILEQESMEEILEEFYASADPGFLKLCDMLSSAKDDKPLARQIDSLYKFLLSIPYPKRWMEEKLDFYNHEHKPEQTPWAKEAMDYAASAADYCETVCSGINLSLSEFKELDKASCRTLFDYYQTFITGLCNVLKRGDWDETAVYLSRFTPGTLVFPRKYTDEIMKSRAKYARDNIKSTIIDLQGIFRWTSEEVRSDIAELRPLVMALFECVSCYADRVSDKKREKNIADFSDVERYMVRLLTRQNEESGEVEITPTAEELSRRFDYIMVDEFQDVNGVQDLIFRALSRFEKNLFMVGDVKQSIYGFRQAMPEIFLNRKDTYPMYDREKENYPAKIILDKNFRSRGEITDGINFVFSRLMCREVGDMDYTGEEALNAGADFSPCESPAVCLSVIDRGSYDPDIEYINLEARYIAVKIHTLIMSGFKVKDGDGERRARYSDFAVLLRSPNGISGAYVNELINMGIPASSQIKESFLNSGEIKLMLNCLSVIDNPIQDIPLLSVMMSPIYAFSADDMAKIRLNHREGNLYSAVLEYSAKSKKTADFLNDISYLRSYAATHRVGELITEIYGRTAYPAVASVTYKRPNVIKNLNLLQEYADSYESRGYKGLSAFIRYIKRVKECECDFEAGSLINDEISNTVRIMSIHSSKGLEFPVCFIAATSRDFNRNDLKGDVLIHNSLGAALRKKKGPAKYSDLPREAVALRIAQNQLSEELRVLYVAMTRAKERLYIINSQKNPQKYLEKLSSQISEGGSILPYAEKNAKGIGDWIFMCGIAHPKETVLSDLSGVSDFFKAPDCAAEYPWSAEVINSADCPLEDYDALFNSDIFKSASSLLEEPGADFIKTLSERINFTYKNQVLTELPVKISASELAHSNTEERFSKILAKPGFLKDENLTPAERGTAFHRLLQFCDFKGLREDFSSELSKAVAANRLTPAQAKSISREKAEAFINSSLGGRIISSDRLFREYRFMTEIPAEKIRTGLPDEFKQTPVLLQGAVDLAFLCKDGLVIVDYKTDRVNDPSELVPLYKPQLMLYKDAMEQSTGCKVTECIIYSLHLCKEVTVYKA